MCNIRAHNNFRSRSKIVFSMPTGGTRVREPQTDRAATPTTSGETGKSKSLFYDVLS